MRINCGGDFVLFVDLNADNWTKDAAGNPVIWNKPPYYNKSSGYLTLLLEGESPHVLYDQAVHLKRIQEYYLLTWRDSAKMRESRNKKPRGQPER